MSEKQKGAECRKYSISGVLRVRDFSGMTQVMGKVRQTLSILLAVAMVVTCVPQAGLTAKAANETPDAIENVDAQAETPDIVEDDSLTNEDSNVEEASVETPADEDADIDVEEEGGEAEEDQDAVVDDEVIDVPEEDEVDVPAGEETEGEPVEGMPVEVMADVMTDGDEHTVTIDNYSTLKDQVTVSATVAGEDGQEDSTLTINEDGTISVVEGKSVSLTLTANNGWKIKSVKNGTTDVEAADNGTYTVAFDSVTDDVTIAVTTVAVYTITVDNSNASGVSVTLDSGSTVGESGVTVEKADETDVKFSVTGYTANNDKLHVSYIVDEAEKGSEITADDEDNYTIPADVISGVKSSVKIVLEIETPQTVDFASNDKVEVQLWGKVKDSEGNVTEEEGWVAKNDPSAVTGAFVGDEFKFKAEGVEPYAVSKVTVNEEEIKLAENGEYTIKIAGETEVAFETEVDSDHSVPLTFTIDGEDNSATAKITSVTPDGEDAAALTSESDIADFLCVAGVDLEAGKAVNVPDTITALTVEVTAANGYELPQEGESSATKTATYQFATEADPENDVAAIGDEMNVDVKTQIEALKLEKVYLTISENDIHLSEPTVKTTEFVTEATDGNGATIDGVYEVKQGATTVELTVKAEEGFKLKDFGDDVKDMIKSVVAGDAEEDGSVVYTVTLFASKITSESADTPTQLELASDEITFQVTVVSDDRGNFTITGASDSIKYGAPLNATITAYLGCRLDSVSYKMGDGEEVSVTVKNGTATVSIEKVTANVTITVVSGKNYSLTALTDANGGSVSKDSDGIYQVNYNGAYLVGAQYGTDDVSAQDINADVKDEEGNTVELTPIVSGTKLKIDLAPKADELAGQEITIDISVNVGDEETVAVGTYILNVSKKTTKIEINGGEAIAQTVDSTVSYEIETDGVLGSAAATTEDGLIKKVVIENGKLKITTNQLNAAGVKDKEATITVTAADNAEVKGTVTVTATPLFDETAAPEVKAVEDGLADTVINVTVGMKDVAEPETGSVWYKVTATPKAGTEDAPIPSELKDAATTEWVEKTGDSQRVKLVVGENPELGTGAEWEYDVTAQLVYSSTGEAVAENTTVASSEVGEAECATVTPLFEAALKLKKGKATTLYTGQSGALVIATPQWSKKNVNYKIVDENITDSAEGLEFAVNADGDIVVTEVDRQATVGKHTITVTATADETPGHTMYASRATITVTVVKGINSLSITAPSLSIYKADKKAATLKTTVNYNPSNSDYYQSGSKSINTPKTKKVTWEIVGAGSTTNNIVAAPENIASNVTVKNGTVTVNKNFVIDERHAANNTFKIRVAAADFDGNTTSYVSGAITITDEAMDISKLVIVDNTNKKVLAVQDGKSVISLPAATINGTYVYVRALSADAVAEVGETFTADYAPTSNLTFASSSTKVLTVGSTGRLTALAANKKVNIKVTANDGSKKTNTLALNLGYTDTDGKDLALKVTAVDKDGEIDVYDPTAKQPKDETNIAAEFTVTGAARLSVQLQVAGDEAEDGTVIYSDADSFTNYKLAVSGGKVQSSEDGYAYITTASAVTKLTLTDNSVKPAKKYVYTLTNKAYDKTTMTKAPKVTVKNSLYNWGTPEEQQVAMTVLDASNKNASFGENKYAKVEIDWSAMTTKNEDMLYEFDEALNSGLNDSHVFALNKEDGSLKLTFDENDREGEFVVLDVGSYKLKVTEGTYDEETGIFTAETLPAAATVKVAKCKTFTYKPTTTYTIGKLDGGAILTGKSNVNAKLGETTTVVFENLQNANVAGRSNNFTKLFKIVPEEAYGTYRLEMTDYLKEKLNDGTYADMTKIDKNDLTGYISYEAWPSVGYYNNSYLTGTVKITVKTVADAKTGSKYTPSKPEVALAAGSTTEVNIMVGSEYVKVGYAAVDTTKPSNELEINTAASATGANAKGQVVLKTKTDLQKNKNYSVTLKVVPVNSFYYDLIQEAAVKSDESEDSAADLTADVYDDPDDGSGSISENDSDSDGGSVSDNDSDSDGGVSDNDSGDGSDEDDQTATVADLIQQYGITVKVTVKASETPVATPDPAPGIEIPGGDDDSNTPGGGDESTDPDDPDDGEDDNDSVDLSTVKTALEALTDWQADSESIVVEYTVDDDSNATAETVEEVVTKLVGAVQDYLDKNYEDQGFTASKKDQAEFTVTVDSEGDAKATIVITVTKGSDSEDVTITVKAEEKTDSEPDQG